MSGEQTTERYGVPPPVSGGVRQKIMLDVSCRCATVAA